MYVFSSCRINKPKNPKKLVRISNKQHEENLESDEGLALLIPDIQDTANLVQVGFLQVFKPKSTKIFFLNKPFCLKKIDLKISLEQHFAKYVLSCKYITTE